MNKEHDILQTYRRREDEFHLLLRNGGWEKLEKQLVPQPVVVRHKHYSCWAWAAVLLLCVAMSVPMFLQNETAEMVADKGGVVPMVTQHPALSITKLAERTIPSVTIVSQSPAIADVVKPVEINEPVKETEPVYTEEVVEASAPKHADVGPQPEQRVVLSKDVTLYQKKSRKKSAEGWSFGIGAGSGKMVKGLDGFGDMDNSMNDPGDSNYPKPEPEPDPEDPDEKPETPETPETRRSAISDETSRLPQLRNASFDYIHRMPLSIGLSIRKNITENFGLESGLSYTFLYSDIRQAGMSKYVGNQRIHYLGIPVKANWTFYRSGVFSMYLSGGVLTEYCVSAERQLQAENIKLDINRWQFSMNASVGAELKLIRPLSLYLEPGLGYYFDNGNSVPTIRKERPWMFGLQLGLRFSY